MRSGKVIGKSTGLLRLARELGRDVAWLFRVYRGRAVFCHSPAAAAAVVLGAEVLGDGSPSGTLTARTLRAAELWHANAVTFVIPTGGVGRNPPSEAGVSGRLLRQAGVGPESILFEYRALNTRDSAEYVAALARRQGIESVLIVTDPLHCVRTAAVFEAYGLPATAVPVYASPMWRRRNRRRKQFLRELVAVIYYGLRHGRLGRRPCGNR